MSGRVGIILILVVAMLTGSAISKSVADSPELAVVIEPSTDTTDSLVAADFVRVVVSAMRRYCQFILYHCPGSVELLPELPDVDSGRFVGRLTGSAFEELLHVTIAADFFDDSTVPSYSGDRSDSIEIGTSLRVNVRFEHSRIEEGRPVVLQESESRVSSRRSWRAERLIGIEEADTAQLVNVPEPWEMVLQRAAGAALAVVPRRELRSAAIGDPIQVVLYVDSAYVARYGEVWLGQASGVVEVASRLLAARLGYRLNVVSVRTMKVEQSEGHSLTHLQSVLRPHLDLSRDTLIVTMLANVDRTSYLRGERLFEVGVAQIGRNRILLNDLPRTSPDDLFWQPFLSGRTLLHEIGHSFGAIHVSDQNSVMSHEVTWLAADRFDPLNEHIVKAALSGELIFDKPSSYLAFVSNTIVETGYNLADYPAFFYDFIHYKDNARIEAELRAAIGRQSYLSAIDAYGHLLAGDKPKAAKLFEIAIASDSLQGSLWFYLALSTSGVQSQHAMEQAARLGYFDARILLGWLRGLRRPLVDWSAQ